MDRAEQSMMKETPFYFVKVWPKEIDPKSRIKEAIKLFEEMDKQHFIMSKKIKRKLFERKQEVSKLKDLEYNYHKVLRKIQIKTNLLYNFDAEVRNFSSTTESDDTKNLDCWNKQNQKLNNFLMPHKTKKKSEENKILREMKFRHEKEVSTTEEMKISAKEEEERRFTNSNKIKGKAFSLKIPADQIIRDTIKGLRDELKEMEKEMKILQTKIESAEKISESTKGEIIRSWMKDKKDLNEGYFCILDQRIIYNEECWVLQCHNSESDDQSCMIYMDKCSSRWTGSCKNLTSSFNINYL